MRPYLLLVLALPALVLSEHRAVSGEPRTELAALALVGAGLMLAGFAVPTGRPITAAVGMALAGGSILVSWACPSPVRELAGMTALVALWATRRPQASSAAWLGVGVTTAAIASWVYPFVVAWIDLDAIPRALTRGALWLLGCPTTTSGRSLFVPESALGLSELVPASATHSGLRALGALCIGAVPLSIAHWGTCVHVRSALMLISATAVALCAQSVLAALLSLELAAPEVALDPSVRVIAMGTPLLVILAVQSDKARDATVRVYLQRAPSALVGAAIGLAALIVGVLGPAPSELRPGTVAFDVGHSFWERLDHAPQTHVYGPRSEYNYADWERVLRARFGDVARIDSTLSEAALADVSVLILKTPTKPYSPGELDCLRRWVHKGGGLLLVGDHTDIFGMNSNLNPAARLFGIEFQADATFELGIEGGQVMDASAGLPHPVADSMRPLHWMTSCTLRLVPPARPVLVSSMVYADEPDYGILTFFGNHSLDPSERVGCLVQAASVEVGRGRVFAFTDSTLLSGFSIFLPGVREMGIGAVSWLMRKPLVPMWGGLLIGLGACVLALHARRWPWCPAEAIAVLVLGVGLGTAVSRLASRCALEEIDRQPLGKETVIDQTVSAGALPLWHESHSRANELWGLSVAFQRQGAWLRVAVEGEDAFDGAACVLTWPKRPLPRGFVDRAHRFVDAGGVLFVFDSHNYAGCATNDILAPFGVRLGESEEGLSAVLTDVRAPLATVQLSRAATVVGGTPIVRCPDGRALAAVKREGRGMLIASGICEDFSTAAVGQSGAIDRDRKAVLLSLMHSIIECGRRARSSVDE